ncbi:MAG TPA: hypothetical protein PK858_11730, partial [Saprospiraceae bacterium]|nr:hypothetical protein [Saprospiraceae bacterium]
ASGEKMAEAWDKKPHPKFDRTIWTEHLAQRFQIKKAGGFCPDEPPFGVRCPASDEKSGEIWTKADLF